MTEEYLSDDELMYLIRQNNPEAMRLLFFRYKKKMGLILKKTDAVWIQRLDRDTVESIYLESVHAAMESFESKKGYFFGLVKEIFACALVEYYRRNVYKHRIENRHFELNEEVLSETLLEDSQSRFESHVDIAILLDELRKKSEVQYRALWFWMQGYRYEEIAAFLKITEKRVYYLLNKSLNWCREKWTKS